MTGYKAIFECGSNLSVIVILNIARDRDIFCVFMKFDPYYRVILTKAHLFSMGNKGEFQMRTLKIFVATLAVAMTVSTSSAFAWGCLAVAYNGGKGWSYHYGNRADAIIRALEECNGEGRGCHIVRCDPWR